VYVVCCVLHLFANPYFLEIAQARPTLHQSLMERMTVVLSQMLTENNANTGAAVASSSAANRNVSEPGGIAGEPDELYGQHSPIVMDSAGSGGVMFPHESSAPEASGSGNTVATAESTGVPQLEDQLASLRRSFVNRYAEF